MSNTTHYGIIGCGMMGQEHIRNIALQDDTTVAVIYEPDAAMIERARELAPNAEFVSDIESVLSHTPLDCLVIASPNFLHMQQLEQLRDHNIPVLVEKPLFTDPAHIGNIDQFISTYRAPAWVAMEYRYMPPVARFLDKVNEATGGVKMLTIREHRFPFLEKVGDWNRFNHQTGGTFVEKCCHFFDLMRYSLQSEPVRVMASGGQDVNHLEESYQGNTPDIFDNGYVIVDFESGARAMLELCMFAEGSRWQEEISAVGKLGRIETRVPGPSRFWDHNVGPEPTPEVIISPRSPKGPITEEVPVDPTLLAAGDHHGSTFYQHQKFLQVVRGERDAVEVSLNDGRMAVLMGMAAQRAMVEQRSVSMDEFEI